MRVLIGQALPEISLPDIAPRRKTKENIIRKARGSVALASEPFCLEQAKYKVGVLIANKSNDWWGSDVAPVYLSYHWFDRTGGIVEFQGLRSFLPAAGIKPGDSAVVDMEFCLPVTSGDYYLEVTLVQEFFIIGLNPLG